MLKFLTINNAVYPIMSKEEAIEKMMELSFDFVSLIKTRLWEERLEQANFIGIGNSLASGWSATSQDVRPFICKLGKVIEGELLTSGIDVNFRNYAIASKNSNRQILEFISSNPTEQEVLKRFIQDKEDWDKLFTRTPFQNYVDINNAIKLYPLSDKKFTDNYKDNSLNITLIDSCTGGFLNALSKNSSYNGGILSRIDEALMEDLTYLGYIILYIKDLNYSKNNIVTIGNFPYISTKIMGTLVNRIIKRINENIQMVSKSAGAYYFDGNQVAFFQKFNNPETGKEVIKMDNHPTIDEQYTVLYYYMEFLMEILKSQKNGMTLLRKF